MISRRLLSNGTLYFSTVIHSRTNHPDEGIYQCVATLDGVGTIVSRTAELKVAGEKRVLFTGPYDLSSFGTDQNECKAEGVRKRLSLSWHKVGMLATKDSRGPRIISIQRNNPEIMDARERLALIALAYQGY